MPEPLESREEQLAVIQANAEKIIAIAYREYKEFGEKGTIILFRQLENNSTILEDWQIKFKTLSRIDATISDWRESGLQDLLVKYNPETSVICTFLYPNGAHTSYHFGKN
jgi:hypothetical protein